MVGPMDALVNPGVKSDYVASGPIAGVLAAQQMQDWQDSQSRSFRDSDIAAARQQNVLENELADNPLKAAERANKLSAAKDEAGAWDSGLNASVAKATREKALEEQLAGKSKAELMQADAKITKMFDLFNKLDDPTNPGAHARNKDIWENEVWPALKANGMERRFSQAYDPAMTMQQIASAQKTAMTTREMIQKSALLAQEIRGKESVQRIHNEGMVAAAAAQGQNAAQLNAGKEDVNTQIEKQVMEDIRNNGNVSRTDYNRLVAIEKEKYKASHPLDSMRPTYAYEWDTATKDEKKDRGAAVGIAGTAPTSAYVQAKYEAETRRMAEQAVQDRFGVGPKNIKERPSALAVRSPTDRLPPKAPSPAAAPAGSPPASQSIRDVGAPASDGGTPMPPVQMGEGPSAAPSPSVMNEGAFGTTPSAPPPSAPAPQPPMTPRPGPEKQPPPTITTKSGKTLYLRNGPKGLGYYSTK